MWNYLVWKVFLKVTSHRANIVSDDGTNKFNEELAQNKYPIVIATKLSLDKCFDRTWFFNHRPPNKCKGTKPLGSGEAITSCSVRTRSTC